MANNQYGGAGQLQDEERNWGCQPLIKHGLKGSSA
jgi:hypothetical protein